jgi:hypothetical protein
MSGRLPVEHGLGPGLVQRERGSGGEFPGMGTGMARPGILDSMKNGGKIKKTGQYLLHEGETVVPEQGSRVPKRVPAKNPKYPGQMCSGKPCKPSKDQSKNLREETRKEKKCPDNQCLAGSVGTIAQISGVNFRPASPNKNNSNVIVRGKVLKHHEKPDIEEDCMN